MKPVHIMCDEEIFDLLSYTPPNVLGPERMRLIREIQDVYKMARNGIESVLDDDNPDPSYTKQELWAWTASSAQHLGRFTKYLSTEINGEVDTFIRVMQILQTLRMALNGVINNGPEGNKVLVSSLIVEAEYVSIQAICNGEVIKTSCTSEETG